MTTPIKNTKAQTFIVDTDLGPQKQMKTTNTVKSAYQVKWSCFRFEGKKKIAKYVLQGTSAMVIGQLVLTPFKSDVARIEKNIANTKFAKAHRFEFTDKQFGLINITHIPFSNQMPIEDICNFKKCKMPNLFLNNNGYMALVPVTNMQFMGTSSLERKTIWI
jgi:hypothetical protein